MDDTTHQEQPQLSMGDFADQFQEAITSFNDAADEFTSRIEDVLAPTNAKQSHRIMSTITNLIEYITKVAKNLATGATLHVTRANKLEALINDLTALKEQFQSNDTSASSKTNNKFNAILLAIAAMPNNERIRRLTEELSSTKIQLTIERERHAATHQRNADLQRQFDEFKQRKEEETTLHQRIEAMAAQLANVSAPFGGDGAQHTQVFESRPSESSPSDDSQGMEDQLPSHSPPGLLKTTQHRLNNKLTRTCTNASSKSKDLHKDMKCAIIQNSLISGIFGHQTSEPSAQQVKTAESAHNVPYGSAIRHAPRGLWTSDRQVSEHRYPAAPRIVQSTNHDPSRRPPPASSSMSYGQTDNPTPTLKDVPENTEPLYPIQQWLETARGVPPYREDHGPPAQPGFSSRKIQQTDQQSSERSASQMAYRHR